MRPKSNYSAGQDFWREKGIYFLFPGKKTVLRLADVCHMSMKRSGMRMRTRVLNSYKVEKQFTVRFLGHSFEYTDLNDERRSAFYEF